MKTPGTGASPRRKQTTRTKHIVAVDARMVGPRPVGIATYVSLLLRGLGVGHAGAPYRIVTLLDEGGPGEAASDWGDFESRTVRAPFLSAQEQIELPRVLGGIAASAPPGSRIVYHSPSFSSLFRCPVPWLVTVHDLIHLRYGSALQKLYYRSLVRPFLRGAVGRMTVSGHSRRELARWAGLSPDTIDVVNGAVDPELATESAPGSRDRVLGQLGLERGRYLFCLSSPKRHKNVPLLIEAYRAYRDTIPPGDAPPLPLVVNVPTGGDIPGVRVVGAIRATDLGALLTSAAAFFFPSLEEGFGFPPLEAAVAGTAVVLSDIPPLREALEPFAPGELTWLDPRDPAAWTRAIREAAGGRLPRPSPKSRGRAVERFSPARLASSMDRIYRRALGIPPENPDPGEC